MSKHRVVKSEFWVDDYFEDLPIKERYFFLYLLTNPDTNILGIYRTTIKRMAFETGLSKSDIVLFIDKFSEKEIDKVHFIESHIIMVNHHKHQMPSSTMRKGIEKLIMQLPFGVTEFILSKKSNIYNRLSIGYGEAIHSSHKDKDKDINKSKDKDKDDFPKKPLSDSIPKWEQRFILFYAEYPKKKAKGDAEKSFKRINPDEQLFLKIIEGVKLAKKSHDWVKNNGQYIPNPATWLNSKRWEDEHESPHEEKNNNNNNSQFSGKSIEELVAERESKSPQFDIELTDFEVT